MNPRCLKCGSDVEDGYHGFYEYEQGFYDYDFSNPRNYRCYWTIENDGEIEKERSVDARRNGEDS